MARLVVAMLLTLCAAQTARGQDRDNVARARLYYETGRLLYDQGDYEQAAKKFTAGYELAPRPQFLLNTGLCYQKMDQLDKAHALYERFLREASADDPDRERAKTWLAEVDAKIAAIKSAPRPPQALPPPSSAPSEHAVPSAPAPALSATPGPASPAGANLTVATTPPPKKSFMRRNWWIVPVGAVVVAGAAVGIYFAARPSSSGCVGSMPCIDLR